MWLGERAAGSFVGCGLWIRGYGCSHSTWTPLPYLNAPLNTGAPMSVRVAFIRSMRVPVLSMKLWPMCCQYRSNTCQDASNESSSDGK